jgi:hypothetical protein
MDNQGGKKQTALIGTPGMKSPAWCITGTSAIVRGLYIWKDYLYAVVGDTLYRVSNGGVATAVGTLTTASTAKVWIAGGTTHLCIVDGSAGYYKTEAAASLTTITDADFPTYPTTLAYQDGYFIVTEIDSDLFYISGLEDASSWDGLDFAAAEDTPDDVLCVISHNRELWMFGEYTTEVFYNSGDTDFPFSRVAGGVFHVGTGAVNSVAAGPEGIFGLDHRFQVRMVVGYQGVVISTPQVEYHIQNYTAKADAIGYLYTQEGHSFYVLTFPTENRTWCYDITTNAWHTRSSGLVGARHIANCHAFFAGKNLVGHYSNGNIYEFDVGYYYDVTDSIQRKRTAQVVFNERKNLFHSQLEIEFEAGVGLSTGLATGTAVLTSGAVSSVTIADGGSGYTVAPRVEFTGGGGSGAVATATITAGVVTAVTVISGGSGYTSAPTVAFVGGTEDPQAMLDWSDDGGHTWSNEHWAGIGRVGDYAARAVWRRLGRSRNRVYRVTITDPVKVVMLGAYLEAKGGMS